MERWAGRVALVTGASSGIGAETAKVLAENGMCVIGCGRNVTAVQDLSDDLKSRSANGVLHPVKCDLRKEKQILDMFEEIKSKHGGVDVCVNCAGLGNMAQLLTGETEEWREELDVNVIALCICTREAFKQMSERNVDDGYIIHINSASGHRIAQGSNSYSFYAGTKHITEGLRQELRGRNSHIRVTAISPGLVDSGFHNKMGEEEVIKRKSMFKWLESSDIADMVKYVLQSPPHVQVHDIIVRPTEQLA
ncbi:dehydrogenase/reductase SDR family member 11-like [Saccoglossus kowalevskii]|uniref:Dehydrogenase/reductase SDR family member 11-like n=1 Tax=Saccoglossus kowalevskii TaxID=10224 RepID=A0ABM0GUL5_SACKO|nr:PREDICTED: dehydrogenase/reductase SDR family member 11-like [Saccoglossus kowalevskii]